MSKLDYPENQYFKYYFLLKRITGHAILVAQYNLIKIISYNNISLLVGVEVYYFCS
jgi:hypothetical protein